MSRTSKYGVPLFMYSKSNKTRVVAAQNSIENVLIKRICENEDIGEKLTLIKLASNQLRALRSQYMNARIKPGAETAAFGVMADDRLIGVFALSAAPTLQMNRNTEKKEGIKKLNTSQLYKREVFKCLADNDSILDFGCGKAAFITKIADDRKECGNLTPAIGIEFYNHNTKGINISKGNRQIDFLIEYLKNHKEGFDIVVCDSVMNSIDSVKAKQSVLACLNLFCKMGGKVFLSGRVIEKLEEGKKCKKSSTLKTQNIRYLDENGFTGNYRAGQWYYQHFDKVDEIADKVEEAGFKVIKRTTYGGSYEITGGKVQTLDDSIYSEALDFEFDLPLPNGKSYKRNGDIKSVYGF